MDFTVCSRNALRDYTWDNSRASYPVTEYAQNFFAPAFEGSLTTSRFAGLFRCPGSPRGVMLGVSASTQRKDAVNRPIRTTAFLRAETEEEAVRLAAFFAECLRKPDAQSLLDATSPVARAVESIYQTKDVEEFLRYCQSLPLPVPSGRSGCLQGRLAIPRADMKARRNLAESLPGVIAGDAPFLLLLADREPEAVFKSSGSMFDRGVVRIFSGAVTATTPLRSREGEGGPKKKWLGRGEGGLVVAGFVLFVLGLAWIGTVYPPPPPGPSEPERGAETNGGVVERQGQALINVGLNSGGEGADSSGQTQEGATFIDPSAPEKGFEEVSQAIGSPASSETDAPSDVVKLESRDEVLPAIGVPEEEFASVGALSEPDSASLPDDGAPPSIPDSDDGPAPFEKGVVSPDLSEAVETVLPKEKGFGGNGLDRPEPSGEKSVAGQKSTGGHEKPYTVAPATAASEEELVSEATLSEPGIAPSPEDEEALPSSDSDDAPAPSEAGVVSPCNSESVEMVVPEEPGEMPPPDGKLAQAPLS